MCTREYRMNPTSIQEKLKRNKPAAYLYCPYCSCELVETQLQGSSYKACKSQDCSFVHYQNPTPIVAIIVELEGEVILARNVNWPEGFYSVISGFVEKGETPLETARRETKEELNLDVSECNFIGHYSFEAQNQLILAYHVKAQGEISLNEELIDYKRIPLDKLKGWDFGTGYAVHDFVRARKAK